GHRYLRLCEQPVEPPEAGAGAVFVDRFHVPVALAEPGGGADDLGQEGFGSLVAVKHAVLAAFFVVDDELHRDMGTAGPFRIRWICPVTAHVPFVTHGRSCPIVGMKISK